MQQTRNLWKPFLAAVLCAKSRDKKILTLIVIGLITFA